MYLQENTLDHHTKYYPVPSLPYDLCTSLAKFEAATSNSFGGDAFHYMKLNKVTQNVAEYPPHQLDLRIQLGRRTMNDG